MNFRIKFGWATTGIWVSLWAVFLYFDWESASKMAFNEWGDFFAGASAPLAFLWLVIGYFQQGEELGQNTKALEQQERALQLQVDELKQSVEQQNKSAIALGRQSEIAGLMARLDSTNHILGSLERQKDRVTKSDNVDTAKNIKQITKKQQKYETAVEKLLEEIEASGGPQ
ncbi:MAG: hypothetical protein RPU15_02905 [Candidatus Sedimenticola sp. (ex Thyasira tokunagai)]